MHRGRSGLSPETGLRTPDEGELELKTDDAIESRDMSAVVETPCTLSLNSSTLLAHLSDSSNVTLPWL